VRRAAALALLLLTACGGGDGDGTEDSGARELEVRVRTDPPGVVVASDTACRFDGERQFIAQGVVKNAGDDTHHVSISVRFIDGDGVRVDLASDSVSDLERGESAHWNASIYNDDGAAVRTCEVSTKSS
jgi:hypothetical protein